SRTACIERGRGQGTEDREQQRSRARQEAAGSNHLINKRAAPSAPLRSRLRRTLLLNPSPSHPPTVSFSPYFHSPPLLSRDPPPHPLGPAPPSPPWPAV